MPTNPKTQATPGPWRVGHSPNFPEHYVVEVREGNYKALICYGVYGDAKHIGGERYQGDKAANARLIAAAPQMREALEALVLEVEILRRIDGCPLREESVARLAMARAALRAANGEES